MTVSELRMLRQRLDTLFYLAFDGLSDEQRLAFRREIDEIDFKLRSSEDF